MVSGIYNCLKGDLFEKQVDLGTGGDTLKVALLSGGHTFTATNTIWGNLTANDISGNTGYITGGYTLSGQSVTTAATTKFDATDLAMTEATFTAAHAVIYDVTNTESLICSIDFGGDKTVSSGTFTIQWNADGIITLA